MEQEGLINPLVSSEWDDAFHSFEVVMNNGSECLKLQALDNLARSVDRAPKHLLLLTVPALTKILENGAGNPGTLQEAAAYCLKCLTCDGDHSLASLVCERRTLVSLLRVLSRYEYSLCQRYLIKCLWGVVTYVPDCRAYIVAFNGLEVVLDLLILCTDSRRRYLLEILSALALVREVRRALATSGELHLLIEAASFGSMVSKERAAQAIGMLGVTRSARRTLVALGVIAALVDLLQHGDPQTKVVAGNALGVISSHVDYIRLVAQAGVIPLYAELLRGPEHLGREVAVDVLCVLSVVEVNAVEIVEHLVRILREDCVEAKVAATDVLWDLSTYKNSISIICNSGVVSILVELLRDGNSDIREKVSGAITQLSCHEIARIFLADAGAITNLGELLQDESEETRDNATESLINFSEDPAHHDRLSEALDTPALQSMRERMVHIRAIGQHMARSLGHLSIEHLTRDPLLD